MSWRDEARRAIADADKAVPAGASLPERMKVIDAAYPFGQRAFHPYKIWLEERRAYLLRHGGVPKTKVKTWREAVSPLERAKLRAGRI
jgi:hypothetical protein